MISFKRILGLICIICVLPGLKSKVCAQTGLLVSKVYDVQALKSDFFALYRDLVTGNPGTFRFITPRGFDSCYRALSAHIRSNENAIQFKMQCDSLVALIRCGHTNISFDNAFSKQLLKDKIFNWAMATVIIRDRWYVYRNLIKGDTIIRSGDEIVSINNIPAYLIIDKTESLMPTDGFSNTSNGIHGAPYMPYVFMSNFWDHSKKLNFELIDTSGRKKYDTVNIQNLTEVVKYKERNIDSAAYTILLDNSPLKKVRGKKIKKSVGGGSTLKIINVDSSTVILTVPVFIGNSIFFSRVFATLAERKTSNLVIDLRGNPGGQITEAMQLLSYLLDSNQSIQYRRFNKPLTAFDGMKHKWFYKLNAWLFNNLYPYKDSAGLRTYTISEIKPKYPFHYNGRVVVLINGGSFSAACIVASYLKNSHRAIFVGRETGGAQYGCNAVLVPSIKLPSTPLILKLPLYSIFYNVIDKGRGHGIMPDYPVTYDIRYLVKHFDPDMAKAKSLLYRQDAKTQ